VSDITGKVRRTTVTVRTDTTQTNKEWQTDRQTDRPDHPCSTFIWWPKQCEWFCSRKHSQTN